MARRYRRAQITSRASRQTTENEGFFFSGVAGCRRGDPLVLSDRRESFEMRIRINYNQSLEPLETEPIHREK